MGGNGSQLENSLMFWGDMGATLHQKPKKSTFCGPWGGVGGGCSEQHA